MHEALNVSWVLVVMFTADGQSVKFSSKQIPGRHWSDLRSTL